MILIIVGHRIINLAYLICAEFDQMDKPNFARVTIAPGSTFELHGESAMQFLEVSSEYTVSYGEIKVTMGRDVDATLATDT